MKYNILLLIFLVLIKTIVSIDSCASSGRCRVTFSDGSTDLIFNPHIGQTVKIKL
jgi:hypothetical protein